MAAGSADTEARVPKARTAKEAILVKENMIGCVDLEVEERMIKMQELAEMRLNEVRKQQASKRRFI